MNNTLLPCPFCGGEARIKSRYIGYGSVGLGARDWYTVECNECRAKSDEYGAELEAIAAWNRRAQSDNEPLTLDADEVVRIDEAVKALHRLSVLLVTPDSIVCREAADLIESLQAQLAESQRRCAEEKCNT